MLDTFEEDLKGPAWSPIVYSKVTGIRPDNGFLETHRYTAKHFVKTFKEQRKAVTKLNRYKREMKNNKENKNKKGKQSLGSQILLETPDLPA